jgi:hypothetical protein
MSVAIEGVLCHSNAAALKVTDPRKMAEKK